MEKKISKSLLSGIFFFIPLISYAQNIYLPEMHEAVSRFVAAGSYNPAFITEFPLKRTSYLQASGQLGRGNFIDYNASDDVNEYGIKTESYYRFNNRIMLYGMMAYRNERGYNMTGSAFIPDRDLPFNIVELADSCDGEKELEAYTLSGAMAYNLNSNLTIGGKVYYQSANYAKFRDLRHQNSRMMLNADVGAKYDMFNFLSVGLSYLYNRTNESVLFGIYGNTDRQYYSLIDFGGFFGRKEVYTEMGHGYTAESTPLFNESHGGAVQLQVNLGKNLKWFNDFVFEKGDGKYGSGDDMDVVYSTHDTKHLGYKGKITYYLNDDLNVLELSTNTHETDNYENSYRMTTDENGVSHIKYFGNNQVLHKDINQFAVSYKFFKGYTEARSRYNVGISYSRNSIDQNATIYPFYRKQNIKYYNINISGRYNWFVKNQVFSVESVLSYGDGNGTMKKDGTDSFDVDPSSGPYTRDDLLQKHYDFLTAQRLGGSIKLGYERNILKNISAYAVAGIAPRYALNTSLEKETYVQYSLQLGVKF